MAISLEKCVISGSIASLIYALIFGLISGLGAELRYQQMYPMYRLSEMLSEVLILALIFGLIGGLGVGSLNHIAFVETISWKWNQFWRKTIPSSIFGPIFGLILGLRSAMIQGLTQKQGVWVTGELMKGLSAGLGVGVIFGLMGGLLSGFVGALSDTVKVDKAYPNQGIRLSEKISFGVFLITLLAAGLIGGLIGSLSAIGGKIEERLYFGLIVGIIIGLISGLNRGGSAVIKHYALRLILWLKGYTPFNFINFLDHCAKLILLKKVGGGYIFIHRMLLDYFADLPTTEKFGKSKLV